MGIFTPDDEPYLGQQMVHQLDLLIPIALKQQREVAAWTRMHDLDRLQHAASMLIPGASSIILSIREMVRQAYLLSAMILLRPLVERLGTLTYLIEHPDGLDLWEEGWTFRTRPKFPDLMKTLHGPGEPPPDQLRLVASRYHSLVHGDPNAAAETLILLDDGGRGFTTGKDLDTPDRANQVCSGDVPHRADGPDNSSVPRCRDAGVIAPGERSSQAIARSAPDVNSDRTRDLRVRRPPERFLLDVKIDPQQDERPEHDGKDRGDEWLDPVQASHAGACASFEV